MQLAVQGKLVEQRPEEGNVKELLEQIKAEKEQLIKDKKIKKEKPLPEITEEEIPFEIPESWEWVRLGEIGSLTRGSGIKRTETVEKGFPCIRYGELYTTYKIKFTNTVSFVDKTIYDKSQKMKKGDIAMTLTGENKVDIAMAVAYEGVEEIAMGGDMTCWSNHLMESLYLVYLMNSPYAISCKRRLATGDIIIHISNDKLASILLPIPPLAEQKRIISKIEEILPYIEQYDKTYTKLETFNKKFPEDMKKSILQFAMQGKLVEQRPEEGTAEELYEQIVAEKNKLIKEGKIKKTKSLPCITEDLLPCKIPSSWKACYIDDIAFVTKLAGFEYTKNIADNITTKGIPLFKGKNVQNGRLVMEFESYIPEKISDELPRSQIRKKCLLTPYVGTIGNIAIFDGSFKAHLGSNVGKIELLNGNEIYIMEEYVLYYLRSIWGYQELTKYKKSTAQESISIDAIRNVILLLPPLAEQKRIVAKLEQLLPYCDQLMK